MIHLNYFYMEDLYGIFFINMCLIAGGNHFCDIFYDASISLSKKRNAFTISTK